MMDNETAVKWLKEIERKYIHGGDDTFDYLRKEAINLATDKLSAQQWIPCSERLPEENGDYIVTDDSGGAIWVGATFFIWDDEGKPNWGLANVTAWMPLPEPYMEDINDG